jgi:hypothetical protein
LRDFDGVGVDVVWTRKIMSDELRGKSVDPLVLLAHEDDVLILGIFIFSRTGLQRTLTTLGNGRSIRGEIKRALTKVCLLDNPVLFND